MGYNDSLFKETSMEDPNEWDWKSALISSKFAQLKFVRYNKHFEPWKSD